MEDQNTETDQGGRPEFVPTEVQRAWVVDTAKVGLPQEFIRLNIINPDTDLAVSLKTLRKHFRRELDEGLSLFGFELMKPASVVALDKNHPDFARMNIWAQQSRLGMKATTVTELVGQDGGTGGIPQLVIIRNGNTDPQADTDDSPDSAE